MSLTQEGKRALNKLMLAGGLCMALAACSEDVVTAPPPVIVAPPPPPPRVQDALAAPITPEAAAARLGSGFMVAFTNRTTDAPIDDPQINDIAEIDFSSLPLNITDPQ